MNDMSLLIAVFSIGYLGVTLYLVNTAELARLYPAPGVAALPHQYPTVVKVLLAMALGVMVVYPIMLLQLALLGDGRLTTDAILPKVALLGAALYSLFCLFCVSFSLQVMSKLAFRQRLAVWLRSEAYQPDSLVHSAAVVLILLVLVVLFGNFTLAGGLEGLADELSGGAAAGTLLDDTLFQTAVFVAAAFLGVGLAIRRGLPETLARLGLRIPSFKEVLYGLIGGIVLYFIYQVLVLVWFSLASPELIDTQTAASQEFISGFNSLPLAFVASLMAALGEEILFRGALQPVFGLFTTAVVFTLFHMQYTLTPAALIVLILGLGLGWIRHQSGTLPAIIAHFLYNFVQLLIALNVTQIGA